jgi:hypothetical protein
MTTHLTIARRRLNERVYAIGQTAVAALVAWYVCVLVLPDPQPLFACIATVVSIGATHGAHRQRATQLVAGEPDELATEELLLMPAPPIQDAPWVLTFSEPEESSGRL